MTKTYRFPASTEALMVKYADDCAASDSRQAFILRDLRDDAQANGVPRDEMEPRLRAMLAVKYLIAVNPDKPEFMRRPGSDMPKLSYDKLKNNARAALSRALKYVYEENAKPQAEAAETTEAPASITLTATQEAAFYAAWEAMGGCSKAELKLAFKAFLAGYEG